MPLGFNKPKPPDRSYDNARWRKQDKAFYSSASWRTVRAIKLREQPICADCQYRPSVDVHHEKERKDYPDLAYDLDNLTALCKPCHNRRRKGQEYN